MGGRMGFAESYLDGQWTTPDLVSPDGPHGPEPIGRRGEQTAGCAAAAPAPPPPGSAQHTHRSAQEHKAYHYDLGNDFYRLWLDPTMSYSCAHFYDSEETAGVAPPRLPDRPPALDLEQAQRAKWDRLLRPCSQPASRTPACWR